MKDALNTTQRDPRQDFETSMHSIVKKESGYAQKSVRLEIVDNVKGDIASDLLRSVRSMVIQLLRNAIDHGMEDPEGRKSAGKPEEGLIRLTLDEEDDHLFIVCEDDGRGLNAELIRMKALEKRLIDEAQAKAMDDFETYRLIFQSGFSTAPRVTELSGRGVGLDVIRGDMKDLKGKIYLSTEPGRRTRFALKIPLMRKG